MVKKLEFQLNNNATITINTKNAWGNYDQAD